MDVRSSLLAARRYAAAIAAAAALGLVLVPLRPLAPPTAFMLLFVPAIVAVARLTDARVSAAAAVAAFLTLDFLFVHPYYTFTVASLSEWIALGVFLAVALTTARQTDRLRQREETALARQRELELLNRASFRAASEESPQALADFVVRQVTDVLGAARAVLYAGAPPSPLATAGSPRGDADELELVAWVSREDKALGLPAGAIPADQRPITEPVAVARAGSEARGAYLPLQTADGIEGVLVAVPSAEGTFGEADARVLAALANLSAACLERQRLEEAASHAEAAREAEELKSTLVASVSHELKTPLAAATARVTGLLEGEAAEDAARVRAQLGSVTADLGRLDASIRDLLDVSRLESSSWGRTLERYDVRELLATILDREPGERRARLRLVVDGAVPDVLVDGTQVTRALANLIDNAFAYSPLDAPVSVSLGRDASGGARILIEDRGPGIADEDKSRVFEKFYRASAVGGGHGSGLGLTIAAEIVRLNDGTIRVEDAEPTGARFVVVLPAAEGDAS